MREAEIDIDAKRRRSLLSKLAVVVVVTTVCAFAAWQGRRVLGGDECEPGLGHACASGLDVHDSFYAYRPQKPSLFLVFAGLSRSTDFGSDYFRWSAFVVGISCQSNRRRLAIGGIENHRLGDHRLRGKCVIGHIFLWQQESRFGLFSIFGIGGR